MRTRLVMVFATVLVAGAGGVLMIASSSPSATAATTLTVVEHAGNEHFTDVGKTGLSPGDSFTFHNSIYDSTDANRVGKDQGSCIRMTKFKENKKGSWECISTTFLENGDSSITVESAYYDTGLGTGAITGGTGTYVGASGSLDFRCTQTECTNKFNLS